MGCNPSKKIVSLLKDSFTPDYLNLNNFPYWYQIFDFLDFDDLLKISPVCKVFHDHTGNNKILKKFQKSFFTENSIKDLEAITRVPPIEMDHNSELEPTPSFRSPTEGTKKNFFFSYESRRSSTKNPSDSLDNFLPSNNLKGAFVQTQDSIMEINARDSGDFKTTKIEPIYSFDSDSDFELFRTSLWQSLQNCDKIKLQKVLRSPRSLEYLKNPMIDWVKNNERMSVLGGAVCTMYYVLVKIVLEYIRVDDLDRGFIIETQENKTKVIKKFTPLQLACARGLNKIVQSLLIKGCSAHISGVFHNKLGLKETMTNMGSPALAICVNSKLQKAHTGSQNFLTKYKQEDINYYECANCLLEFSANPDINTLIPIFPTPLFLAINNLEFLKLLLKYRANPNWTNSKGQTPLYMIAERFNNVECAKVLVEAGGLIDPATCRPLFVAINSKNIEMVKYLKDSGANINGSDEVPSALQVAISGDDVNMCMTVLSWPELLIDWTFRQNGKNMFHRIAMNQGNEVFDSIVSNRSDQDLAKIKLALNQSCFIDSTAGDTIPLYFALNDLKLAKKFLDYGSDITRINVAKALLEKNLERPAIQFLIENKADLKAKKDGKCPVWVANDKARIDLLVQIVKGGGDINSENALGVTVLHDSCLKGLNSFVKILLNNGADPKKVCRKGMNALDYACAYHPKKNALMRSKIEKLLMKFN
jgi:ankyrin repeat protein